MQPGDVRNIFKQAHGAKDFWDRTVIEPGLLDTDSRGPERV